MPHRALCRGDRIVGSGRQPRSLRSRCSREPPYSPGTSRIRNSPDATTRARRRSRVRIARGLERAAGFARGAERRGNGLDRLRAARLGRLRVRRWERRSRSGRLRVRRGDPSVGAPAPFAARGSLGQRVRMDWSGALDLGWLGRWVPRSAVLQRRCRVRPCSGTWRMLPAAPIDARTAFSVWTGEEMIVWGSTDRADRRLDGAAYDPITNAWRIDRRRADRHHRRLRCLDGRRDDRVRRRARWQQPRRHTDRHRGRVRSDVRHVA